jgi:hypothetical protein
MADKRSVDKGLGFSRGAAEEKATEIAKPDGSSQEDGAYEDSWYQVLKAQADEVEES